MSRIVEAITEWFGTRCPDFNADCACCQAWAEYDGLVEALEEMVAAKDDPSWDEFTFVERACAALKKARG